MMRIQRPSEGATAEGLRSLKAGRTSGWTGWKLIRWTRLSRWRMTTEQCRRFPKQGLCRHDRLPARRGEPGRSLAQNHRRPLSQKQWFRAPRIGLVVVLRKGSTPILFRTHRFRRSIQLRERLFAAPWGQRPIEPYFPPELLYHLPPASSTSIYATARMRQGSGRTAARSVDAVDPRMSQSLLGLSLASTETLPATAAAFLEAGRNLMMVFPFGIQLLA